MRKKYIIALINLLLSSAYSVQAEIVQFKTRNWDIQKKEVTTTTNEADCILIEGQNDEWQGLGQANHVTYYAVKGDVKRKTLNCFGEVHLVILDGASLTCTGGIKVLRNSDCDLHIHIQNDGKNEGRVNVTNSYQGAAAIGSSSEMLAGDIFIHGGTINATGGEYAAGIGGGSNEDNDGAGAGKIYVYAGTVTAQGGLKAAGIGSGSQYGLSRINSGELYVYGGTVKATGGKMGAGVGGGCGRDGTFTLGERIGANGGRVYVYGGTLNAQGGLRAAGIGSGSSNYSNTGRRVHGGWVRVYGGEVTANGGEYGAGIGGGCNATGADIEITGGTVRATGGKNSAGIGGGEDGQPGQCRILGGKVIAIAGANCECKNAGKGSAIGFGRGESKDYEPNHLQIDATMSVTAGDAEDKIECIFSSPERIKACQWRNYARIEPCAHKDATYTIIDGEKHRRVCSYCLSHQEVAHDFGTGNNHHDCVCGQKVTGETTVLTITRHYKSADNDHPDASASDKVIQSKKYLLAAPPAIDGLVFMGYSTEVTEPGEMLDSEDGKLISAGEITLTDKTEFYARYRYAFNPEWAWNANNSEATVTIKNSILQGSETLTATIKQTEDQKPTASKPGRRIYTATATYKRKDGITYTFIDDAIQEYNEVAEISLDANKDNSMTLLDNQDRQANVTIQNLTFQEDGKLHSFYLPFSTDVKGTPLEGVTIYGPESQTITDGQLQMTFKRVTDGEVEAGVPYFVKLAQGTGIANPVFKGVFLGDGTKDVFDQYYELCGTYDKMNFNDDDRVLVMENGKLCPPDNNSVKPFTVFLYIPNERDDKGKLVVTSVKFDFEGDKFDFNFESGGDVTGIKVVTDRINGHVEDIWYDLQGRPLNGRPGKGIYIRNGKKIVIK